MVIKVIIKKPPSDKAIDNFNKILNELIHKNNIK